jgi:hypothetical protein
MFHNKRVYVRKGSIPIKIKKKSEYSVILFAYLVSSEDGNENFKAGMLFQLNQIINLFI